MVRKRRLPLREPFVERGLWHRESKTWIPWDKVHEITRKLMDNYDEQPRKVRDFLKEGYP
jgi:hypothetical protein